ncbi:MAG: pyridoxamine 5'-phosphate oxidase family protein [archaeon]|nr:pyridoxamine 5'-phosphate oxidase family protein [archaeon]
MAAISENVKKLFADHKEGFKFYALATSSSTGVPNVVPIGFLWVANDDEIWVIDNYLKKTLANIKENPVAAAYAIGGTGKDCVQIKGPAVYENSGADYEAAVKMAHSVNPGFPAKGLVKIRVAEVYDTTPGPNAGELL